MREQEERGANRIHAETDSRVRRTRNLGRLALPTEEGDEVVVEVDGVELDGCPNR